MKKLLSAVLCFALLLCAPALSFAAETNDAWTDSTTEEIMDSLGLRFGQTAGMEIFAYQTNGVAAQMTFQLNGVTYEARIQPTASFENISGYSDLLWSISTECTIGWCEANAMMTQSAGKILALCLWYDAAPGLMYSVSALTDELKGLDIQSAAEAVFAPMQDDADGITAGEILGALIDCTGYAGTAGSSLKNAIAACNLAAFAAENQLADLDELFLSEAAADAISGLDEDQKAELSFNLESIHSVLSDAFTDYESIRGLFEDAGAEEQIMLLMSAHRTFDHFSALYDQLMAAGL